MALDWRPDYLKEMEARVRQEQAAAKKHVDIPDQDRQASPAGEATPGRLDEVLMKAMVRRLVIEAHAAAAQHGRLCEKIRPVLGHGVIEPHIVVELSEVRGGESCRAFGIGTPRSVISDWLRIKWNSSGVRS